MLWCVGHYRSYYSCDMLTRYVDGTPTSEVTQSLSGTSAHPTMVTQVNIMVMNGWLTYFSFHVNRPYHSWDNAISDVDLDISTPGSRSWVWSKGKITQSAQYHINSFHFHFTSIRPTIPESYFEIWPWNIQGQGQEWGQRSRSHIVPSIQPMHFLFCFTSIGLTIPEIWPIVFDFEKTHQIFYNENLPKLITMTRAIKLPCFVVIRWVVLILSRRQADFW